MLKKCLVNYKKKYFKKMDKFISKWFNIIVSSKIKKISTISEILGFSKIL